MLDVGRPARESFRSWTFIFFSFRLLIFYFVHSTFYLRLLRRNKQQSRIRFIILDRRIVRPKRQHVRENGVQLFCVALRLRGAEPALLRDAKLGRFGGGFVVGGLGEIERAIFFRVTREHDQLRRIPPRGFQRALPIIFLGRFFAQLRIATREIHFLHNGIEREGITVQQVANLSPAAEPAERVDVL